MANDKNKQNTENIFIKSDNKIKKIFKFVFPKLFFDTLLKFKSIYLDKYIDFILYKIIKIIILKLTDPIYKNLPTKHCSCLYSLNQFLLRTKNSEYEFFLIAGSLLGSVRQESFAGRPTDVDLGILSTKLDLFINDLNKIDKKGISRIDKFYDDENFLSKVQVLLFGEIIDISIFRPCNLENRRLWKGEYRENQKNDKKYIFIENQYLTSLSKCKLYNYNYLAPSDPEKYLENKYGDKWKVPNKKQFVWNKKF